MIYTTDKGQYVAQFEFKPEIIETQLSFIGFCLGALKIKFSFFDDDFLDNLFKSDNPNCIPENDKVEP
ncbi:hypothetical protein, partial [Lactococcus petauri]|uniref:hypothetical protein n=1 Tax=Lactococcus petauri TaxID=1940789 RepID=UPI0021F1B78E